MNRIHLIAVLFCIAILGHYKTAEAQAVRYDYFASTTSSQCAPGAQCPILALPGSTINFCSATALGTVNTVGTAVTWVSGVQFTNASGTIQIAGQPYTIRSLNSATSITIASSAGTQSGVNYSTLAACLASPATTYTSTSAGATCPTTAQLTPQTGGACRATSDSQGNYGAWMTAGLYSYYLRVPTTAGGGTYGPFPISIGASAGCQSNGVCDANYATLALACAAAGSETLYVSRAWDGTPTGSCVNLNFLATGKIAMAINAVLTVTGTVTAPSGQQIWDTSSSGSSVSLSSKCCSNLYPQWWGAKEDGSTDDTKAFQAAVTAGLAVGIPVSLAPGIFELDTVTSGHVISIGSVDCNPATGSSACGFTMYGTGTGTTYLRTTASAADLLQANTGVNAFTQINIGDFQMIGPDSAHAGAVSGNGLYIAEAQSVIARNIRARGFYGTGKSCFVINGPEETVADSLRCDGADIGALFEGSSNQNVVTNLQSNFAYTAGVKMSVITGGFYQMTVQGSTCDGVNGSFWGASTAEIYLENNNTSSGGGCHGLNLNGVTGPVRGNTITTVLSTSSDDLYLNGTGGSMWPVTSNVFISGNGTAGGGGSVNIASQFSVGNTWVNWDESRIGGAFNVGFEYGQFLNCSFVSLSAGTGTVSGGAPCNIYTTANTSMSPGVLSIFPAANLAGDGKQVTVQVNDGYPTHTYFKAAGSGGSGTTLLLPNSAGECGTQYRKSYTFISFSGFWVMQGSCDAGTSLFAGAPLSPFVGQQWIFTDSNTNTWGATIAGSGMDSVLGMFDGSDWTVVGK